MNNRHIIVPKKVYSNKKGYEKLIETVCSILDMKNGESCIMDFSEVDWIDANLLSIIVAAIEKRQNECHIKYRSDSINQKQADLWGRNGFGKYFSLIGHKRYDTTVDYKVFGKSQAKDFGKYIDENLLTKSGLPELSSALKRTMSNNIQEIFGNAPLHGECEKVISCGQYFHKKKELIFTIVDCGNTIKENVERYFSHINAKSPPHGIAWAVVEDNSTKEIVNGKSGGKGLALLKEFISLNGGEIHICSGKEIWEYKNNDEKVDTISANFPGTIVTIKIRMDDNKSYSLTSEVTDWDDLF